MILNDSSEDLNPIFLVGSERSGTTVLRLMLSHHTQIAWCQEFEYVVDRVTDDGQFPNLDQYYEWLETHRVFQARSFLIDRNLDYCQLVNSFLYQQKNRDGKTLIGATVHRHFDRLLKIWPDARFIHLIRDARDVARSCISMGWSGNVWTGARRWVEAEQLWQKLKTQISAERYIEITYENLIETPEEVLTKLCHFLGTDYHEAMLSYPQNTTYELPNSSFIQQWKHKLSEQEVQLIESRASDLLQANGYQLSGLPPLTVSSMMVLQLKLQDWWSRVAFRVKRFGLGLFIADYLSRNLKIKSWERQIQLKMNEISSRYLK